MKQHLVAVGVQPPNRQAITAREPAARSVDEVHSPALTKVSRVKKSRRGMFGKRRKPYCS